MELQSSIADYEFIHVRNIRESTSEILEAMDSMFTSGEGSQFAGIRIHTCANRTSIMYEYQYQAYIHHLGLRRARRPPMYWEVEGIIGRQKAISTVKICLTLTQLKIDIDVKLLMIPCDIPSMLPMRVMTRNGLGISLQEILVTFAGRTNVQRIENYFNISLCRPTDITFPCIQTVN